MIANLSDAADVSEVISAIREPHVVMGCQGISQEYLPYLISGRYVGMDLRGLGEGRLPTAGLIARLAERGIDRVVNAGTLAGLLDTTIGLRVAKGLDQLEAEAETQRLAAMKLERAFARAGIRPVWLAGTVPEFGVGQGIRNDTEAPLRSRELHAAVRRAKAAVSDSPVACAWLDHGQDSPGMKTFDTDEKLKNLAGRPPPAYPRVLVKIVVHARHSPFDPPMIGPPTIKWAINAHVRAIMIDAERGVIVSREKTLRRAAAAGIAIIGV